MAKGYVIAQMSVVNQEGYLAYAKQVPGTPRYNLDHD